MSTQPLHTTQIDQLPVSVYATNEALGAAAADEAAEVIRAAVAARGVANIIVATGNSQLTFLAALRALPGVPWEAVNVFHMDEYVNLPPGHPASFPAFLRRHLLDYVQVKEFFPVPGEAATPRPPAAQYEALLPRPPGRPVRPGHRRERPPGVQRSALRRFRRPGLGKGGQAGRALAAPAGGRGPLRQRSTRRRRTPSR